MITSPEDLSVAVRAASTSSEDIIKAVYTDSSCGVVLALLPRGVEVSVVVGNDNAYIHPPLYYPFTEDQWTDAVQACEDFADAHWGEED